VTLAGLIIAVIAFLGSVIFNFIQSAWRRQDRIDHATEKAELAAERATEKAQLAAEKAELAAERASEKAQLAAERAAEKAELVRKEQERFIAERLKEQAPPQFHNFGGTPGPIRLSGMAHALQGPLMDVSGLVTIVNPTGFPLKISLVRLVIEGKECPVSRFFFREKGRIEPLQQITVTGNHKEHYELHCMFPDNNYPSKPSRAGQLWVLSDNREEPFAVEISCP
jgi:hypothetical protein